MQCTNQGHRWVINPLTGGKSWTPFPCGHCIACLHNQQDSWAIRLNETAKAAERHEFIYDTLTFSPQGMPYMTLDLPNFDGISKGSRDLLSRYSREYARVVGEDARYVVPFVTRDIIRDWIRQARELFVYHHGFRPKWKYVVFMEYGPKSSRPHFHLLFFNVSLGDYVKYLAKPWRRSFGFTKTKVINNESKKGRQCVSRYVSKYCSKGVFESPLVRDGLAPKPFRSISHGIGEEYLRNKCFDSFRTYKVSFLRDIKAKPVAEGGFDYSRPAAFDSNFPEIRQELKFLPLDKLSIYLDESAFKHSLPRYYKSKLLDSSKPNYFHCAVQDLLLARTEQYYQGKLFEFALQMGLSPKREASYLGFSLKQYNSLDRLFVSSEKTKAKAKARGRFIELKNHYLRPLRDKAYAYVS